MIKKQLLLKICHVIFKVLFDIVNLCLFQILCVSHNTLMDIHMRSLLVTSCAFHKFQETASLQFNVRAVINPLCLPASVIGLFCSIYLLMSSVLYLNSWILSSPKVSFMTATSQPINSDLLQAQRYEILIPSATGILGSNFVMYPFSFSLASSIRAMASCLA